MGDFLESIIWSSLNNLWLFLNIYKDNFQDDYLISKPNYLIYFLIIISIL
jgi:hypothetical protein